MLDVVILAAGAGRRLRSRIAKPLLPLAEQPLLAHVLQSTLRLTDARRVIVCPPDAGFARAAHEMAQSMSTDIALAVQNKPRGTADALRRALPHLRQDAVALVLCADSPLVQPATLRALARSGKTAPALLTFAAANPEGYGRVLRQGSAVARIVEERDASRAEREITEVYAGAMALPAACLANLLERIGDDNAAGERYLTDIAALATADGMRVSAVLRDESECAGVNTAADLERLSGFLRRRRAQELLASGARLADAARLDVRGEARCGRDVEIDVNVILAGRVTLGDGARIGANCVLRDCRIGAGTVIHPFSHLEEATVGANCTIGPYARLRPAAVIESAAHVGNFVEVKNSRLRRGVRAGHLAYLGDADVGANVNVGAGVITCNYDGRKKHRTIVGADAFIGSDCQLVAPARIGRGAYVAAGTTVTRPVPAGTLAISRAPQTERPLRRVKTPAPPPAPSDD